MVAGAERADWVNFQVLEMISTGVYSRAKALLTFGFCHCNQGLTTNYRWQLYNASRYIPTSIYRSPRRSCLLCDVRLRKLRGFNVGITAWPVIQPFPADVLVHSSLILEEFTKEKSRVASQHHKSLLYKNLYFRELRGWGNGLDCGVFPIPPRTCLGSYSRTPGI